MARINSLTNFLTDVATAIRSKKGSEATIAAEDFDTEILNLPAQGEYQDKSLEITTNGNYRVDPDTGYDAMDQVEITVNVPIKQLQSKAVTITSNGNISIFPDANYNGMTQVDLTVEVEDPEYATNLALSQQILNATPVLPYIELEYIYDTGMAYINSNIIPDSNTRVVFGVVTPNSSAYWFGSQTYPSSSPDFWCREVYAIGNDNTELYVGYYNSSTALSTDDTSPISETADITFYKGKLYVNGALKITIVNTETDPSFALTRPLYIFATNRAGSPVKDNQGVYNAKISYFKIYENDTLICDLIPVRRKSDNVIGMYDKVTNEFFMNNGTGSFMAGPVKS